MCLPAVLLPARADAEVRPAREVFGKWVRAQGVRVGLRFSDLRQELDLRTLEAVRASMPQALAPAGGELALLLPGRGGPERGAWDEAGLRLLGRIYDWLDRDVRGLVEWLRGSGYLGVVKTRPQEFTGPPWLNQRLVRALVRRKSEVQSRLALMELGNRFFEYCLAPATHGALRALVSDEASGPLVRFLFHGVSYPLARTGWRHWHLDALEGLARRSREAREIVYIAGGTDVYRLLQWGVRRLRVIDPMLPSQARFYSEGWAFLLEGALGDEIVFSGGEKPLRLVRTGYRQGPPFAAAEHSGSSGRPLQESTTEWAIRRAGEPDGELVFERRFARQDDFRPEGRTFVVSSNELFFVANPGREGRGIDVRRFAPDIEVYVKQLRAPLGWASLQNLRWVLDSPVTHAFGTQVD